MSLGLSWLGFSWQEYWSELPFPPLGDLPDSGIEPVSLVLPALQADSLPLSHQGSPGKSLKIFLFILKLACFFHDSADVGNLISGSSAFSKTSLNIRKFTVHILLKPGLENFEHYFTSV